MSDVRARPNSKGYRADIDGLRAVAILSVVLFHAGVPLLSGGFAGVDMFFVISGYLIGGQIFSEATKGSFSFLEFYRRRAKRILPALYVVLACTLVGGYVLLSPAENAELGRSAVATVLSVSNIVFWHFNGYFAHASSFNPLLMTWSLGVEEQFYIFVPIVLIAILARRRNWLIPAVGLLCTLSFLFAWFEVHRNPMMSFYLLPARGWELGAGSILAILETKAAGKGLAIPNSMGIAGWILVAAPLFLFKPEITYLGPALLPTILGTVLVIATPGNLLNRFVLSSPPMVFIGRISYSWYLWHWPLFAFLHIASPERIPASATILAVAISFILAVASYYLIEQRFRRSPRSAAPLLLRYGMVSFCALSVCAVVWLTKGMPSRYPVLDGIERTAGELELNPCLVKHQIPNQGTSCYLPSNARPSIALWGDSHSTALAPGVRKIAQNQGDGFAQFAKGNCIPLIGAANAVPGFPLAAQECSSFNRRVLDILRGDSHIQTVILTSNWNTAFPNRLVLDSRSPVAVGPDSQVFVESLKNTIQNLQSAGKQVIIVTDVPGFDFDPLDRTKAKYIPARLAMAKWMNSPEGVDSGMDARADVDLTAQTNSLLKKAINQSGGTALLFDPSPTFCPSGSQCLYREGDHMFYADQRHLSAYGADFAVKGILLSKQ